MNHVIYGIRSDSWLAKCGHVESCGRTGVELLADYRQPTTRAEAVEAGVDCPKCLECMVPARLPGQGDQNSHMAEKENGKTDEAQADRATVSVRWPADGNLPPATFANQFFVHRVADEVRFSFGQIAPIVVGSPDEQREQVAELQATGLVPKSVTRVILTTSVAAQLLGVLAEQLGAEKGNS